MTVHRGRGSTHVLASVALACSLVICGSGTGSAPEASTEVVVPEDVCVTGEPQRPEEVPASCGEVRAVGQAVLDSGEGPELCLGVVAASLPPQCTGPRLVGWSWGEVEHQTSAGVRHSGGVLVTGTFDGTTLTLTDVSTRDDADPSVRAGTPSEDASAVRATPPGLRAIQEAVMELPGALVGSRDRRAGTVDLLVVNDDGRIQAWCDAEYGLGVVRVTSAMEPIRRG